MPDDSFINILLLGETGVGKSTFINSFVNYLTYNDFNKAEKENLITLIPSKCYVQDRHGEHHSITIGAEGDSNECLDTGMSATQGVKSYVFPFWRDTLKRIRLIDTPGIGDVRGIEQDNINCENILNCIKDLEELHAICYLLKPTNSRITIYFDYCMTQILSRLDKSASRNLIFIFTNSRGSDYTPGDTLVSLEKIIVDIRNGQPSVNIPFGENVFCFDNEAFRYLAAIKKNIELDKSVRQRNHESWRKSVGQINNLIKYIIGDEKRQPLQPHLVRTTSAINSVKGLITILSQHLAQISRLFKDNQLAIQRHEDNMDVESNAINALRPKLWSTITDLQKIHLNETILVCASSKCAEKYKVGNDYKLHYRQICQVNCDEDNIRKDIIGCPEVLYAYAIDAFSKACIVCDCDFSAHMFVSHKTVPVKGRIVDRAVNASIDVKEKLLQNARETIKNLSAQNDELEKERETIVKTCTKYTQFLKNNVILPFSKSYKEYIEYLIMREKSRGVFSKSDMIDSLQKLLGEYEATKQSFDEALSLGETVIPDVLLAVRESMQNLYKLKHNGEKFKNLYDHYKEMQTKKYGCTEYVHLSLIQFKKNPEEQKVFYNTNYIQNVKEHILAQEKEIDQSDQQSRNQENKNQSQTSEKQNYRQNRHEYRGRFQYRGRGRGRWKNRRGTEGHSQTRNRPRNQDNESEESQSSDIEKIESISSENDPKKEGDKQPQTHSRSRRWSRNRGNARDRSQSPNKENNQQERESRFRGRGNNQWQGRWRGRQSQNHFKSSKESSNQDAQSNPDTEELQSSPFRTNSKSRGSENDQTVSSRRGRGGGFRPNRGRPWQNRGRGNNQAQARFKSWNESRNQKHGQLNNDVENEQSHNTDTSESASRSGYKGEQTRGSYNRNRGGQSRRSQWQHRDRDQSQIQFGSHNQQTADREKSNPVNQTSPKDSLWSNKESGQSHTQPNSATLPRTLNTSRDHTENLFRRQGSKIGFTNSNMKEEQSTVVNREVGHTLPRPELHSVRPNQSHELKSGMEQPVLSPKPTTYVSPLLTGTVQSQTQIRQSVQTFSQASPPTYSRSPSTGTYRSYNRNFTAGRTTLPTRTQKNDCILL